MQGLRTEKSQFGAQANNLNVNQHSPQNDLPGKKILPLHKEIFISMARCGFDLYNEAQLIEARNRGCAQLPINFPNKDFRLATPYVPDNPAKYIIAGPYYLYPVSKPILNILNTHFHDFNRIVLTQKCDVVGVLSETPKFGSLVSQATKFMLRRPQVVYKQQDYNYNDCTITPK
ncbi:hypothetical protein EPUL_002173, partial [Erysiphe pulchra]